MSALPQHSSIILASASPRRSLLLGQMGIEHRVAKYDFNEDIPAGVLADDSSLFLAELKTTQINKVAGCTYITADTVVVHKDVVLGKPKNASQASEMLNLLSNGFHDVVTGVCISNTKKQVSFKSNSRVYFKKLTQAEIDYYIHQYKPFDKAGSYGIQEWIGMIAIERIEGCYYNIMGLPTHALHKKLTDFLA